MVSSMLFPRLVLAFLLSAALVAPSLATSPTVPAAIDLAAVPPRPQAPNDQSAYRRLELPNGMKALLLSDPKLNVASASVAVAVGSLSDPPGRPGLAHYLEHMLFLGTQKYPSEAEYGEYLRRNGGYHNAYTASDRTNYHLEVQPGAFEGALDRFAQFFIAPLFTPEFNEREVNAVNSEYQKNLENDSWRQYALEDTMVREGHPARHFSIGSRETLAGTTREELLAFHHRYYSANRMTLALTGPRVAGPARAMGAPLFRARARPAAARAALPGRLPAAQAGAAPAAHGADQGPAVASRCRFPLPDLRPYAGSKPAELVGYVLGNEGPGSLLAALKAEGLATGLSAGAGAETPDYGSFDIQISLTPEGLQAYPRVLAMIFAAIDFAARQRHAAAPVRRAQGHGRARRALPRQGRRRRPGGGAGERGDGLPADGGRTRALPVAEGGPGGRSGWCWTSCGRTTCWSRWSPRACRPTRSRSTSAPATAMSRTAARPTRRC